MENRLQEIIKRWEEDNHAFADTCESLVRHFKERYNRFEGELRILQGALSSDEIMPQDQRESGFELTITDKIAIFVTSPIWIPISLNEKKLSSEWCVTCFFFLFFKFWTVQIAYRVSVTRLSIVHFWIFKRLSLILALSHPQVFNLHEKGMVSTIS